MDNVIWMRKEADGNTSIGFRKEYIESKLQECFHILAAGVLYGKMNKDAPMLVLETMEDLTRIRCPFGARLLTFNEKAKQYPDRLKEEDVVLTIVDEETYVQRLAATKKPKVKIKTDSITVDPFLRYDDNVEW